MGDWEFEIVADVRLAGSGVLEDVCGASPTLGWMIDGATALDDELGLGEETDAAWFAQHLGSAVSRNSDLRSPDRVLEQAICDVDSVATQLVGNEKTRFPSAAVALAMLTEQGLSAVVLADCVLLMKHLDGSVTSITRTIPVPLSRDQMIERRRERNTASGLWVARREPLAAKHAVSVLCPVPEFVFLASDGALNAVTTGVIGSIAELTRSTSPQALGEVLSESRARLAALGERPDDASVLCLRVRAGRPSRQD